MSMSDQQYGELKSLINQVGENVRSLEARVDARDGKRESSTFSMVYKFEITIKRDTGMYVAETVMNWAKSPSPKAIDTTPVGALKKLVSDLEANQIFHKPGAVSSQATC